MLNFFRKPLGFAIFSTIFALINPVESSTNYSSLVTYFIIGLLINLAALLLYRLLIKQEPFTQDFIESSSKYWASIWTMWILLNMAIFNYASVIIKYNLILKIFIIIMMALCSWAFQYVLTYFYLWLTDKIAHYFIKINIK